MKCKNKTIKKDGLMLSFSNAVQKYGGYSSISRVRGQKASKSVSLDTKKYCNKGGQGERGALRGCEIPFV